MDGDLKHISGIITLHLFHKVASYVAVFTYTVNNSHGISTPTCMANAYAYN